MKAGGSFERNCQSIQSRSSPLHPPQALTPAARCGVYINRSRRQQPPVDADKLGRSKHARLANGIWKLHLREDHRHAGWIPDPGAGMPARRAAAAAAGSHGCCAPRHILRTTRIQLCPVCAPQTHHAHGESNISILFYLLSANLSFIHLEPSIESVPDMTDLCAPCVITRQ